MIKWPLFTFLPTRMIDTVTCSSVSIQLVPLVTVTCEGTITVLAGMVTSCIVSTFIYICTNAKPYVTGYVFKTRMPPFPNISRICLPFYLDLWPTDQNIDRDHLTHQWLSTYQVWSLRSKTFWIMTFDLDLLTWKINREHLTYQGLSIYHVRSSWAKRSWVISCKRLRDTDRQTYSHTNLLTDMCIAICPSSVEATSLLKLSDFMRLKLHAVTFTSEKCSYYPECLIWKLTQKGQIPPCQQYRMLQPLNLI